MALFCSLSRHLLVSCDGGSYCILTFRQRSWLAARTWSRIEATGHAHGAGYSSKSGKLDGSQPYGYYQILGLQKTAKQSDVKEAYFRLAKIYHPDVNNDEHARENFDQITEAYTTLIDLTQRYFYDQHGHTSQELKKKGTPSIFEWQPKYGIYQHRHRADKETSDLEDWFKAQGHVGTGEGRISLRQRLKNAYVELRFGLNYFDFPWRLSAFFAALGAWIVGLVIFRESFIFTIKNVENRRPIPIYLKWENDEIYDILWYAGARKNKQSDQSKGGLYHMPKGPKRKSEYSHTIYSNTRSRTKSKNIQEHQRRLAERRRVKKSKEQNASDSRKRTLNMGFTV